MTAIAQSRAAADARAAADETIRAEAYADEPVPEDGMDRLRSAAEEQLRENATKIAKALAEKASCGDLNATKILLLVVKEKPRPRPLKRRDGPSEAARLAAEPPWQEPSTEQSTEPLSEPFLELGTGDVDLGG